MNMTEAASALAILGTVVFSIAPAIAAEYGPGCVRLWVDVLAPRTAPPHNSILGQIRQSYAEYLANFGDQDPVDYISGACRMDRALVRVIINDEMETGESPRHWDLPQPHLPQLRWGTIDPKVRCSTGMDMSLARRAGCDQADWPND
jgi:hypothetical protein